MTWAIVILGFCLGAALVAVYAEGQVIRDLNKRVEDASMWIDPIVWEDTKNDNE